MSKNLMIYALECQIRFLAEKRTESYKWYGVGASQEKIVCGAKNAWQGRALPGLERRGAKS
jgi:hypothetical protein